MPEDEAHSAFSKEPEVNKSIDEETEEFNEKEKTGAEEAENEPDNPVEIAREEFKVAYFEVGSSENSKQFA